MGVERAERLRRRLGGGLLGRDVGVVLGVPGRDQRVSGWKKSFGDDGVRGNVLVLGEWVLLGMRVSSQFIELERGQWKMFSRC